MEDLVGGRARSELRAKAAEEKVRRLRLQRALRMIAGSLRDVDIPGWETPEAATAWVAESRAEDDRRLDALIRDR
jgi:hypothetical protein